MLGFVACRVCSKLCGIGPAKRAWAAVKTIKTDKRSHLGGKSIEKRSVIYITAKQQEGRLKLEQNEKIDAVGRTAILVMMTLILTCNWRSGMLIQMH